MDTKPTGAGEPGSYEIRIRGRLDDRWARWFDDMELDVGADGVTTLSGRVVDQAALHGLLARLRDVGLPLLSVERVGDEAEERELRGPRDDAGDVL